MLKLDKKQILDMIKVDPDYQRSRANTPKDDLQKIDAILDHFVETLVSGIKGTLDNTRVVEDAKKQLNNSEDTSANKH